MSDTILTPLKTTISHLMFCSILDYFLSSLIELMDEDPSYLLQAVSQCVLCLFVCLFICLFIID